MFARLLASFAARKRAPGANVEDWCRQGVAQIAAGAFADAVVSFERALAADPGAVAALHGRAALHQLAGENAEAVELCDAVLARAPRHIDALTTRAFAQRAAGRLEKALADFERAVAIEARSGLIACVGGVLFQLGRLDAALATTERALAADPEADYIHSNRLFMLNHVPGMDRAAIAREHMTWGRRVEARVAAARLAHGNARDPHRRLRVAYVSADLRQHSVAYFIAPVLERHDRSAVEVFCYDNHPGRGDATTRRLAAHADHWVRIAALDDMAFAARVRADAIDVLVDLSGHTGGNRLPVFAMRPAPVQASWFGYMNTTGLATIDYRITDATLCPPGAESLYAESLFRLPSTAAWSPAPDSPAPGPAPRHANGQLRFGSFNNWTKVSDAAVALWSRLLGALPGARLLVVAAGGDAAPVRAAVTARFASHGVAAERIEVRGTRDLPGFLELLAGVDIALDPFPYNGGTTTLHSLWMGVPVISMRSAEEVGRVSTGLLAATGIADLCAADAEGYLQAAVALAGAPRRLDLLRAELRTRLAASEVMDGAALTRNLEKAYRAMWHNYLDGSKSRTCI
jgi:predicted O-linked N-acetylglucosamine transferase (SPINDLY family)